jgi:two-component system sensor histidine kinase BaeS
VHRSLLVRLLAVSVLVAVCAIAATAWLASTTTSGAIQQEQGQALSDDSKIYQGILGYASTHPNWGGVGRLVTAYAQITGHRVALTTPNRVPIADSAPKADPLPNKASAVVDPLAVDPGLVANATADRIDVGAVGPFKLNADDVGFLAALASRVLTCVQNRTGSGTITTAPNGRPSVVSSDAYSLFNCKENNLEQPVKTEQTALDQLDKLVNDCLSRQHHEPVAVQLDFGWTPLPAVRSSLNPEPSAAQSGPVPAQANVPDPAVQSCITSSRHEQLTPYVSPPALLFITTSNGAATPATFSLSRENKIRVAGVAGGVLLLTIAFTVLAGARLIRPLRALTGAARRMGEGDVTARVDVKSKDEIGRLAVAFNNMSENRERLEATRKAMVSDIAHELRTPLSNIRGWLEATQDGISTLDDELVTSLLEEALHLQHIVDDLQDLSMADAGKLRVHPEPVSGADILAQVAAAHTPRAAAADVTLSVDTENRLDLVADPVRLRQAIDNLVSNALRATPAGGTVALRGRREGVEAVFEIADTGIGIDPDDLPRVFDRFWRADKSRTRQSGGSGLGLAIVRQLAEAHGGSAGATSIPGQGSTFTLRFPLSPDD